MRKPIIKNHLFCFLCFYVQWAVAQDHTHIKDSLLNAINSNKEVKLKMEAYFRYGELYKQSNPDSALYFFEKGIAYADENNFPLGRAYASSYILSVLNLRGEFLKGLTTAQEALTIYQKYGTDKDLSSGYINVGSEWEYFSEFNLALENYLKALPYAEKTKNAVHLRAINNNIASVYIEMGQYNKGITFAQKAYTIADSLKNTYAMASSLFNIAIGSINLKKYTEAEKAFEKIYELGNRTGDTVIVLDGLLGLGNVYENEQHWNEAMAKYKSLITMAERNEAPEYKMNATFGQANVYKGQQNYKEAIKSYNIAIALAKELGAKREEADFTIAMAEAQQNGGDYKASVRTFKQGYALKDSLFKKNNELSILSLDAKYQTERKEATIELQQASIKRKQLWNYLLGGSGLAAALIGLIGHRNYRHRQSIQQQRITELETEKQLAATEAVLKGEEQERTRLAKDLHDGLGGMLSGIKYSFNTMKGNIIMTPDNVQAFERSMDMLDSSIREMRRVAHNMMPEALVKFGLDAALKDFCNDINQSGALKISYESFGMAGAEINQSTAITVYRIVQELLNNTMKHAAAKTAIVQLSKTDNQLSITVEDDGKGFDTTALSQKQGGMGWSNIINRINLLNGKFDVDSTADKGTSVNIEINVKW